MMSKITLMICFVCVSLVICEDQEDKKRCHTVSGIYKSGETFTTHHSGPCVKYICEDGEVARKVTECEDSAGVCHPQEYTYTEACITKRCELQNGEPVFNVVKAKCIDVHGQCHLPSDKFTVEIEGILFHRCTCKINDRKEIEYMCN